MTTAQPARDVAIVGFAHAAHTEASPGTTNGVEMLAPVFAECFAQTGLDRTDIDFWCSGSSDYLAGRAFSFISAIEAIGATPSIQESHIEGDAAWALFEAWLTILSGHADTALVYGFGKASASHDLDATMAAQLDPYTQSPLGPGRHHLAALQARAGCDAGLWSPDDLARIVSRARGIDPAEAAAAPQDFPPLTAFDCPPVTDGACAVILAAGPVAERIRTVPAWIAGLGQAIDSAELGARDLTASPSVREAARQASGGEGLGPLDIAELHTPYSHQEIIVRRELGLGDDVRITPSGGSLAADPMFSAGLERIGYAAKAIYDGGARRTLGHASSGPLLQHNLVALLEGRG